MALGSSQPLTGMSTRNLPGGKKRPARRVDNLAAIWEPSVWKCGSLSTACTGITLPLQLILLGRINQGKWDGEDTHYTQTDEKLTQPRRRHYFVFLSIRKLINLYRPYDYNFTAYILHRLINNNYNFIVYCKLFKVFTTYEWDMRFLRLPGCYPQLGGNWFLQNVSTYTAPYPRRTSY
jgi:hypothetical protein